MTAPPKQGAPFAHPLWVRFDLVEALRFDAPVENIDYEKYHNKYIKLNCKNLGRREFANRLRLRRKGRRESAAIPPPPPCKPPNEH